jgi:hypothetical protein
MISPPVAGNAVPEYPTPRASRADSYIKAAGRDGMQTGRQAIDLAKGHLSNDLWHRVPTVILTEKHGRERRGSQGFS